MRAVLGWIVLHVLFAGVGHLVRGALRLPAPARGWAWSLGPSLLIGIAVVVPVLIVLLVVGVPLTLVTFALVCVAVGAAALAARLRPGCEPAPGAPAASRPGERGLGARLQAAALVLAAAYMAVGAWALARVPTRLDDARIWSLRGLALSDHHTLVAGIFLNQAQSGGHPIYPLFQPALEALTFQAMGGPQLGFFHAELWLVFVLGLWLAADIIRCRVTTEPARLPGWIAPLILLALTPAVIRDLVLGDADVTGSILLGGGAVALAAWLERRQSGLLPLAAILLGAAASTKDEDLFAAGLVLLLGLVGALSAARGEQAFRPRAKRFAGALLYVVVIVAPWRVWTAAHHLYDTVRPPLPRALSPLYVLGRSHQLHRAGQAMLASVDSQWRGLAAVFIVTAGICIATGGLRRIGGFYVALVGAVAGALLWLYTTTPLSLAFLLPTSVDRTVILCMIPAGLATADLLAAITARDARTPAHRATACERTTPPPAHRAGRRPGRAWRRSSAR